MQFKIDTQGNVNPARWHRDLAMFPFPCWEGSVYAGFPPPGSTQESSCENVDGPSWDTLLRRCKPCPGKETNPRLAPEEWLPYCIHHKTHPPAARSEEQATRASVTIPYIHGLSQSIRRVKLKFNVSIYDSKTSYREYGSRHKTKNTVSA